MIVSTSVWSVFDRRRIDISAGLVNGAFSQSQSVSVCLGQLNALWSHMREMSPNTKEPNILLGCSLSPWDIVGAPILLLLFSVT